MIATAIAAGHATVVTFDRRHLLNVADVIAATFGVRVVEPGIVLREISTSQRGQ